MNSSASHDCYRPRRTGQGSDAELQPSPADPLDCLGTPMPPGEQYFISSLSACFSTRGHSYAGGMERDRVSSSRLYRLLRAGNIAMPLPS